MPGSDISRLSFASHPKSEMASQMARNEANQEISRRINSGMLDRNDVLAIQKEWRSVYREEYYKCYAIMAENNPQMQIVVVDNPASKKFLPNVRHAIGSFSKSNFFIHVSMNQVVTVSKFEYPIDSDKSLETKEAFLNYWPGPLDRHTDPKLKRETANYIEKLLIHTKKRRIRYERNDEQREVILRLLYELLHRDGSIDASSVTKLLLDSEQADIRGNERPLEMLQKYLLLGQRSEAIKHATEQGLWDLMLCLTFLDQYQPPPFSNSSRIMDVNGLMVQSNTAYIDSMDDGDRNILKMVYRSLLNNILKCDQRFVHVVKRPNVDNDPYRFAILSANDCDMEYDRTNEKFNLINAIKTASRSMANCHLVSLGLTKQDTNEPRLHPEDELLDQSLISLGDRGPDTYAKRTHIISNIDLLILNEIWELCYNLARGATGLVDFEYNINLVPYKLVFAARLLDAGLYEMFASYLRSMKAALEQGLSRYEPQPDSFYDWDAIVRSVKYLSDLWRVICESPHFAQYRTADDRLDATSPPTEPITFAPPPPPATFDTTSSLGTNSQPHHAAAVPPPLVTSFQKLNLSNSGNVHSQVQSPAGNQSYQSSVGTQNESAFSLNQSFPTPPMHHGRMSHHMGYGAGSAFSQPPPAIAEEFSTDFNPDPEPYDEQDQADDQQQQQQQYEQEQELALQNQREQQYQQEQEQQRRKQQHQQLEQQQQQQQRRQQQPPHHHQHQQPPPPQRQQPPPPQQQQRHQPSPPPPPPQQQQQQQRQEPAHQNNNSSQSQNNQSQNQQQQQQQQQQQRSQEAGLIASIAGRFLPKSNSKPMILPDDSNPSIVYDEDRGTWLDTNKPEGDELDLSAPPPIAAVPPPPSGYSFAAKSSVKSRYPRAQV